jgi:hypothetical protein
MAHVRLYLGCYAGRDLGTALSRSGDQGTTWSVVFPAGQGLDIGRLAAAADQAAGRW